MEDSKIILSIGVPVYNVDKYLHKCVDSLLAQDLSATEYEIILVDDGSTDTCPKICDDYAEVHANVRVIHQSNAGLSAARNTSIKAARGTYLMFLDSDDYLEPNVLGSLVSTMEKKNLDVLRYNYQNVHENGDIFVPFKTGKPFFDYRDDVLDGEAFLNERLGYACYAWAFILRRDLIIGNQTSNIIHNTSEKDDCLFTPGIYFEDTDWTPRMLMKAKRVSSTEKIVYNYLWREGSITLPDNSAKKRKVLEDKIKLLYGFHERRKLVQDQSWFIWQIAGTTISVLGILSTYTSKERNPYINQLKSLKIFPLSTYRSSGNVKRKIMLANFSPALYCNFMHFIHK